MVVKTASVIGAASKVEIPQTHRSACSNRFRSASERYPPANVPRNPVATTIAPNCTVATVRGTPRVRSRNAGIQNAIPPTANVYAAYPSTVSAYGRFERSRR